MTLKSRNRVERLPGCPMSACMRLIGGQWTPEILWAVSRGPRRFSELRRDCPFISSKVMAGRLRDLQERNILTRTVMSTSPPTVEYELTPLGQELVPVLQMIVSVGTRLIKPEMF